MKRTGYVIGSATGRSSEESMAPNIDSFDREEKHTLGEYTDAATHNKEQCPWWKPIETAPWGKEVLVTGPSGYEAPRHRFIINASRQSGIKGGAFTLPNGDRLSDFGWEPLFWCECSELPL